MLFILCCCFLHFMYSRAESQTRLHCFTAFRSSFFFSSYSLIARFFLLRSPKSLPNLSQTKLTPMIWPVRKNTRSHKDTCETLRWSLRRSLSFDVPFQGPSTNV